MALRPVQSRTAETTGTGRLLPVALLATLLWRLPSFFDPPWVNDEGTYFAVAQAMSHGYRLYADVWENKPPGLYLMYSAVYHLVGASLITVRLLALLSVLVLVVLVYQLSKEWVSEEWAIGASFLTGMLFDVPFLEGTTANAEVFMATLSAGAIYVAVVRRQFSASGVLFALACLIKVVAVFDLTALFLWLGRREPRPAGVLAAAAVVVLSAAVALAWLAGILPSMLRDALMYDFAYVGHGNGGGLPWLLIAKAALLIGLAAGLRRAPLPVIWLVFATAGSLVSGRIFGHYVLQALAPASICLALLARGRTISAGRLVGSIAALFLALALGCGLVGWGLAASGHDSILARRLQYYPNFVRLALGAESYSAYRDQVDDHVSRNIAVAQRLRTLPAGAVVVWGNVPWVFVLSDRLPATPYTSSLRHPEVPGETTALRRAVERGIAREVVVIAPPLPDLGPVESALHRLYLRAGRIDNATIYVRRAAR